MSCTRSSTAATHKPSPAQRSTPAHGAVLADRLPARWHLQCDYAASPAAPSITRPPTDAWIDTTTANSNPTGGQQTILGGYATVGGTNWAVSGTGMGSHNITALSSYNSGFAARKDVDAQPSALPRRAL